MNADNEALREALLEIELLRSREERVRNENALLLSVLATIQEQQVWRALYRQYSKRLWRHWGVMQQFWCRLMPGSEKSDRCFRRMLSC